MRLLGVVALAIAVFGGKAAAAEFNRSILPVPDPPFKGKVELRAADSVKDFPEEVKAPEGTPNMMLILTDDGDASGLARTRQRK
jgi:hypothetical protein